MKSIFKLSDEFDMYARILPIMIVVVPIILNLCIVGIIDGNGTEVTVLGVICFVALMFLGKVSREKGKAYEKKMYDKLGGMPTTILMRYTDNRIDYVSKTRFHKILSMHLKEINLPSNEKEETEESDSYYISAITWLRTYANAHREELPRVYQELKEYNFWRNLYGVKWYAILLYIILGVFQFILLYKGIIIRGVMPSIVILVAYIFLIMLFVNKKTVNAKAFDYAKALIESCDLVNKR